MVSYDKSNGFLNSRGSLDGVIRLGPGAESSIHTWLSPGGGSFGSTFVEGAGVLDSNVELVE